MSVYDREWAREDVHRRDALPHAPAFALGAPPRGREPSSPPAPQRRMGSVEGMLVALSGLGLLLTFGALLLLLCAFIVAPSLMEGPLVVVLLRTVAVGMVLLLGAGIPAGIIGKIREE
jgi:hypothetical protein